MVRSDGLRISFVDKEMTYAIGDTLYANIEIANNMDKALKFGRFGGSCSLWLSQKDWLSSGLDTKDFIGIDEYSDSTGIVKLNPGERKALICAFVEDDEALKDIPSGAKHEFQLHFRQNFYEDSACFTYNVVSTNELTITIVNPQE